MATLEVPRVGGQRPGGRSARVRADVLAAVSELLSTVGYDGLSVEEVAAKAGVHKTTVYRRWPTKPDLVLAAVTARSEAAVRLPDTGSLAGDLKAFCRDVAANISTEEGGLQSRSLVAAAATSEELAGYMSQFWADRLEKAAPMIDRAIERGELPEGADSNLIIETLIGPLWVRLLLTGGPIDNKLADRVAKLVAVGAAELS